MIREAIQSDAAAISEIYNHFIATSIATFELQPTNSDEMWARMSKHLPEHPWLVFEESGRVLGYAYSSPWKDRAAYSRTLETSIYLHPDAAGKGAGTELYGELIARARSGGYHTLIGGISLPNAASVALHEKMGYEKVAHFKETGWKHDQWIDVGYWQLML